MPLPVCPRAIPLCEAYFLFKKDFESGVQHLLHLKSKSKILQPIEIMGFFMNFFVKFKEIFCCNRCIFVYDVI